MTTATKTIAADIEKTIEGLRGSETAEVWSHYVNEYGVPVKRRVRIGDEVVDGAALSGAA